ncbi:MAG: hypothetical protein ACTSQJ_00505 [Promethearchaeota archaeon]
MVVLSLSIDEIGTLVYIFSYLLDDRDLSYTIKSILKKFRKSIMKQLKENDLIEEIDKLLNK